MITIGDDKTMDKVYKPFPHHRTWRDAHVERVSEHSIKEGSEKKMPQLEGRTLDRFGKLPVLYVALIERWEGMPVDGRKHEMKIQAEYKK